MRTLIVEDDFSSRLLLKELLKSFGPLDVAVNGEEAVEAVQRSFGTDGAYDLICMDIMMPKMDGQTALKEVRKLEAERGMPPHTGAKIVMTTAVGDMRNVVQAFADLADGYLTKPIDKTKLLGKLRELKLIA